MNANASYKEKSKLLVAVAALFVIMAGAIVAFSDSSVDAASSETQLETSVVSYSDGTTTVYYDTLAEAIEAVPNDGTAITITLLKNTEGIGIQIQAGENVTIDFDGFTYNVTQTVGSTGTETNAAQLLKGSTVTFKNGTFTSDNALRMIQNYCDLTLENMIIDGSKMLPGNYSTGPADYTTIATNCGDVVIKGTTTIIDKDPTGDTEGRISESIAVSHWDNSSYGNEGTSLTIAEDFTGDISRITVNTDGDYGGEGTATVNVEAENVKFDILDIEYGFFNVGENSTVTVNEVTVAAGATFDNKGTVDSQDFVNNGTVTGNTIENMVNNGVVYTDDGKTAQVSTVEAFVTLNGVSSISKIVITDDISLTTGFWLGTGVTLDLNGFDLKSNGNFGVRNGAYVNVPAGSEFNITYIKFPGTTTPDYDWLITSQAVVSEETQEEIPASKLSFNLELNATFVNEAGTAITNYMPDLTEGISIVVNNVTYTVYEIQATGGTGIIQYGIGLNDLYYRGSEFTLGDITKNNLNILPITPGYIYDNLNATLNNAFNPDEGGEPIKDADTYVDALHLTFNLKPANAAVSSGPTFVTEDIDVNVLAVNPSVEVTMGDSEYGMNLATPVPSYEDQSGATIANGQYDKTVLYSIVDSTGKVLYQGLTAEEIATIDDLPVGDYTVVATFPANNQNFNETTAEDGFKVTPTTLKVDFAEVAEDTDFWGTGADRYMNYDSENEMPVYAVDQDGNKVIVSGGIYYIANVNEGASVTIFGSPEDKGFYLLLDITNSNTFPVTVKVGDGDKTNTIPGEADGVDNTLQLMVYIGTQLDTDSLTLTVTPVDNDDFGPATYTVDCTGLVRMTTSGYAESSIDAIAGIGAEGMPSVSEAWLQTTQIMWIAFDNSEFVGTNIYGYLYYEDELVYYENLYDEAPANGDSGRIWYFSFADGQGVTNWLVQNPVEGYVSGQPGKYTMYITTVAEDFVPGTSSTVISAVEYIEGYVDSGFSHYSEDAVKDLQDVYAAYGSVYDRTDISDNTLWFSWYQEGYVGQTVKAYVSTVEGNWDAENLWINGDPMLDADGIRAFAWSFDTNQGNWVLEQGLTLPETVYVKIVATDADGVETIVATGTIDIIEEVSEVVIDDAMDLSGILGKKPLDFMDITVYQNGTTVTVRGDVYLIDSWEDYFAGVDTEGYYIALTVDPAFDSKFFDWSQATVTLVNPNNPLLADESYTKTFVGTFDGELLLYIGKDLSTLQNITLEVDLDGSEPFLTETEYTIDISGIQSGVRTYAVTYIDENYGTDGYYVTEYIAGNILTLPVVPDTTKEPYGWDVDNTGVQYNCGTRVDLSQLDTDGDYAVTFYAKYAIGGSTGGDVSGADARQLEDYYVEAEFTDAGLVISIKTDKTTGYRNVLTTVDIDWFDWDTETGNHITRYINEPKDGVVISYTIPGVTSGSYQITVTGLVGTSWLAIGDPVDQGMIFVDKEAPETPLLEDNYDGNGNPMTITIVQAPEDASADNNYPWLQVNYERLQPVDSVTLEVDGEVVSFVWVDYDSGEAIEAPESIPAGDAFFQFSYKDGDVIAGESTTFTITVESNGEKDTIEMTIVVPDPAPETA